MHLRARPLAQLAFVIAVVVICSCSAGQPPVGSSLQPFTTQNRSGFALRRPALIAANGDTGTLEFWPIKSGGGDSPQPISPPLGVGFADLAAHGNVVAIAGGSQVATGAQATLPEPFGIATGIAIDKNENF